MTFKTESGKKTSLTIDDPKPGITQTQIKNAMETIVAKNIFLVSGADIVEALDAKVVVTDTTGYNLV